MGAHATDPEAALVAAGATPEEAAAVMVAILRYERDHSAGAAQARTGEDAWLRAARLEEVGAPEEAPTPWGDPHPWRNY